VEDYLKRAWEAEQQARRARTPEERKSFEEIAELWRRLAETEAGNGAGKGKKTDE
jgi:hypothetical protein